MRLKEIDGFLWLNGVYTAQAVSSSLTKHKYPKEPLYSHDVEADQRKGQEKLLLALTAMQTNYELSKENKDK